MRSIIFAGIMIALATPCQAQNCVINGGTNYGNITQNCTVLPPTLTLLKDHFETEKAADGLFNHQILVRINSPINLVLTACGDGVADVTAFPYPTGMFAGPSSGTRGNCKQKLYQNVVPQQWMFSVRTKAESDQFTLMPAVQ